jgi:hypothetical protein
MSDLDGWVNIRKSTHDELLERNRMLSDIALSAICLKMNIENGFPPHLHALNRDIGAFQRRFSAMPMNAKAADRTERPERTPSLTDDENHALLNLINVIEAMQDWSGTRVGAAIEEVDRLFFVRLDDPVNQKPE